MPYPTGKPERSDPRECLIPASNRWEDPSGLKHGNFGRGDN